MRSILPLAVASLGAIAFASHVLGQEQDPLPATTVARPLPPKLQATSDRALRWLLASQRPDGGWGADAAKNSRSDVGTTAFAGLALMRADAEATGPHEVALGRATSFLLEAAADAPSTGTSMGRRDLETQLDYKLGSVVDAAFAAQFFARRLQRVEDPEVARRLTVAAEKCVQKVLGARDAAKGTWGQGGWAPVLATAIAAQALEAAEMAEVEVEPRALERARELLVLGAPPAAPVAPQPAPGAEGTQTRPSPAATPPSLAPPAALGDAGVPLYTKAARARSGAKDVREAREALASARAKGLLPKEATKPTRAALTAAGMDPARIDRALAACATHEATVAMASSPELLRGFGNQGGEEVISYMMLGETLVVAGEAGWTRFREDIGSTLSGSQQDDGSWTGQHCIMSPTILTSAAVLCLNADKEELFVTPEARAQREAFLAAPGAWDRVNLRGRAPLSASALLRGLLDPETGARLLPIAQDALRALPRGKRDRLAPELCLLTRSTSAPVRKWAHEAASDVLGQGAGTRLRAWGHAAALLEVAAEPGADLRHAPALREQLLRDDLPSELSLRTIESLVRLRAFEAASDLLRAMDRQDDDAARARAWSVVGPFLGAEPSRYHPDCSTELRAEELESLLAWAPERVLTLLAAEAATRK